jgi:hypothetical protein
VEGLGLVALTHSTSAHEILHQTAIMIDVKVLSKALQGLLYAFMSGCMRQLDHWRHHLRRGVHEHLGALEDQTIDDTPWFTTVRDHRVTKGA